jgi:hypothetical protein
VSYTKAAGSIILMPPAAFVLLLAALSIYGSISLSISNDAFI